MAATLLELRNNIRRVFNIAENVIPCLPDGTRIETEDYFQSLTCNERISYFVVYPVNDYYYYNEETDDQHLELDDFIMEYLHKGTSVYDSVK